MIDPKILTREEFASASDFWSEKLKSGIATYGFFGGATTTEGESIISSDFTIDETDYREIRRICKDSDMLVFSFLSSVVHSVFHLYGGENIIASGVPVIGSNKGRNTLLPLISSLNEIHQFKDLLTQVKQYLEHAYRHQEYPLNNIAGDTLLHSKGASAFEIVIAFSAIHEEALISTLKPRFLFLFKHDGGFLQLQLRTNIGYKDKSVAISIGNHLKRVINQVAHKLSVTVHDLEFMNQQERETILSHSINNEGAEFQPIAIHKLIEERTQQFSDRIALTFNNHQFTFSFLNAKANQLANLLKETYHIKPNDRVGVSTTISEWSVISFLAILKCEAVYVPIPSQFPKERIEFMLRDSQIRAVLLQAGDDFSHIETDTKKLSIYDAELLAQFSSQNMETNVVLDNPSYIIYTSGTTGNPMGVIQTQRCLSNLIQWQYSSSGINDGLRHFQFSSLGFDVSIEEFLFSLYSGGHLILADSPVKESFEQTLRLIITQCIESVFMTPGYLTAFVGSCGDQLLESSLSTLISAGEQIHMSDDLSKLLKNKPISLYNFYGPSETHVVTSYRISLQDNNISSYPPIGKPVANTRIYILNKRKKFVPLLMAGEIYIGGSQVATGYSGNEQLTQERFIPDPFNPGEKLYKTGDYGRWLSDGTAEYLGRVDNQVKIRGYRVELGEIERLLLQSEMVKEAVVLFQPDKYNNSNLVAYIRMNENAVNDVHELRNFLAVKLPDYIIPQHFIQVNQFKFSSNGKIDRKFLQESFPYAKTEFIAPSNETETVIAGIWAEILNRDALSISITDDFFELGGNSLKGIMLVNRIQTTFKTEISLKDIFKRQTIKDQAAFLQSKIAPEETGTNDIIEISL